MRARNNFRFKFLVEIVKVLKCKLLLLLHIWFSVGRLTALFRVQYLQSLPTFCILQLIQFNVHIGNFDLPRSMSCPFLSV
jgi:hypothetical protein